MTPLAGSVLVDDCVPIVSATADIATLAAVNGVLDSSIKVRRSALPLNEFANNDLLFVEHFSTNLSEE